ncbi:GDP-mannose mannosyl hydrolase [Alteromonas sp. ASW11-19]|uniref:GDP-mannose mannosyl hydrolase n=1 Tax=Alteromonas salexigens TaxID=2982530 RepID=A0ABT2VMX8_9ALTE|nr:GDP-mannose mannosyl hydrolase [Alteromonas salexigens]MCU7554439.1 GDP-mannose mannosyl hydrolase [Alteromonas salexigens]
MGFLSKEAFTAVIDNTPLVSIDLVVENDKGEVLLGFRNNRPAQGLWFVPGGRILKNESLDQAFLRLSEHELGVGYARANANLLGVYEHFYEDSVMGSHPSTHYVVLGYHLEIGDNDLPLPLGEQHQRYIWMDKHKVSTHPEVHAHSAAYIPALELGNK